MAILPYMKQLPQDYYRNNYPAPVTVVAAPVEPPALIVPPIEPELGTPTTPETGSGVWTGSSPPASPNVGWQWLNPANNGLYLYTQDNVWTQVGTNW